jgi:hypothetical protein
VSLSTNTSSDQHSDLPDSSLSASTVTAHDSAFIWNNPPSHPQSPNVEDEPLCRDTTFSLPFAAPSSQILGTSILNNDDELSLVPSLPDSPRAIFDSCIMRLRRQFEGHADPGAYALDLFQFVMAREGVLGPQSTVIPEIRVSSNDEDRARSFVSVSSPTTAHSATRSHRSPTHCCVLCSDRQLFTSRGSLKRHVSNRHRAKSEFRCPFPQCHWRKNRKDKLRDHLRRHGFPLHWTRAEISQLEAPLPVPTACEVCSMSGFQSWDEWFECIERHCLLPQPAVVHELPDGQGGGSGSGSGGFSGGDPSGASGGYGGFLNPGDTGIGMDFMGNGGGYQRYLLGGSYSMSAATLLEDQSAEARSGRTDRLSEDSERNTIPGKPLLELAGACASHRVSTPAPALHSPDDLIDDPFSSHSRPHKTKRKLVPGPPSVGIQDYRRSKCRRCGHVSAYPPEQGSAEYCHKCTNLPTIPASARLRNVRNHDQYQDRLGPSPTPSTKTHTKPQHEMCSKMPVRRSSGIMSFSILQLKVYIRIAVVSISINDIAKAVLRRTWGDDVGDQYLGRGESSGQVRSTALDVRVNANLIN